MNDNLNFLISFVTGFGLGNIFFYGLWRTLEKITTTKSPALLFVGSAIFRLAITMVGFYIIAFLNSDGQLKRLLLCLFGFLVARYIITKKIKLTPIEVESES